MRVASRSCIRGRTEGEQLISHSSAVSPAVNISYPLKLISFLRNCKVPGTSVTLFKLAWKCGVK